MNPFFSILVVCLNPGEKLNETLKSVLCQTYSNYEIVIKDGLSTDHSIEKIPADERIRVVEEKDKSIYDAMNQAIKQAKGDYLLFLNCGDSFYDEKVLENAAKEVAACPDRGIYYGNTFCEKTNTMEMAAKEITPFVCFRNIPCHQACFYHKDTFTKRLYEPKFKIRADYEHFLWCCLKEKMQPKYMDFAVAKYEGGGYSESKANRQRDRREHKEITKMYLSSWQLFLYNAYLVVTLVPLRRAMAESKAFSGFYQKLKAVIRK